MLIFTGRNFICKKFLRQVFIWIPAVAFGSIGNFVAIFELVVVGIALAVL